MNNNSEKKFVIKPFRAKNAFNEEKATKTWKELEQAIHQIHQKNASCLSFEELYRGSYSLVLHNFGDFLYTNVSELLRNRLIKVADKVGAATDVEMLESLAKEWEHHKLTSMRIGDVLMYMDHTYASRVKKLKVFDLALKLFYECVVCDGKIRNRIGGIIWSMISWEREGQVVNREVIKIVLGMLKDLSVGKVEAYEMEFEDMFLVNTRIFYEQEGQVDFEQKTCAEFLKKTQERLCQEQQRVLHYLHSSTEPKLLHIVETELIAKYGKRLIDMEGSGCVVMLRDDRIADLTMMYTLFRKVEDMLPLLKDNLYEYAKSLGQKLVEEQMDNNKAGQFVQDLLALQAKFVHIVEQAFLADATFKNAVRKSFQDFMNTNTTCAALLAKYVDGLFRKGLKGLQEGEIEKKLEDVITLFRLLQDKDIFEDYYKKNLAKRLISNRSVSNDAEKLMLAKLKAECGYQYTSKLEGMFKDMAVAKDIMAEFTSSSIGKSNENSKIAVNVLTSGYWPIESVEHCILPTVVKPYIEAFQKFYSVKHEGRKLQFRANLGTADIKAIFGTQKMELNVSTYQMIILLLFNEAEQLTFSQIQQQTQIPVQDLKRHLISLCTPKLRILQKQGKGKEIALDEIVQVNNTFTSKHLRIRIPLISEKEPTLHTVVPESVLEDRNHLLEAAIVRIMKARKTLQHNNLIAEVTKQLSTRFSPPPQLIKRRIESLIEREYLERHENDRRIYNYLA